MKKVQFTGNGRKLLELNNREGLANSSVQRIAMYFS
jgi:hypothetical protein